jgi:tetratricopeptide (TPR) repeat protein
MSAPNPYGHDIFVSYSRQDADWAGAFVETLKERGWRVFLDTRAIRAGDEWSEEIDAAIDAAKVVIGVWSKHSVRSSYVIAEVARAVVRGTLIPLSIDRTDAPPAFRRFQTQPMLVDGATTLPRGLVTTIERRLAATEPMVPSGAEEQRLRDELERSAALSRERGVPLLALQTQLERLGEVDVAKEEMPARLESFVSEFLSLKSALSLPTNADPDVATTQRRALELVNAGDLNGARRLIDEALERQRERYRQTARQMATLLSDRARIDVIQVRYPDAIATYEEASAIVGFDADAAFTHLKETIRVLIRQGEELGNGAALLRAIELIRTRALPLVSREHAPLDWAELQVWRGSALASLGEQESRTAPLRDAATAYRMALEEYNQDRRPLDWAMTQRSLGNALRILGELDGGTEYLEDAVTACQAASKEYSRERLPLHWAATQNNLGIALATLGERKSNVGLVEQAAAAYRAALQERTRDRVPLDWAWTHYNLGNALATLGQLEGETARLEEAVTAYRAALEECSRDRVPLRWAGAQHHLGLALLSLGERETGTSRIDEAVTAFRAAQGEYTLERAPLHWAATKEVLDKALAMLAKRSR